MIVHFYSSKRPHLGQLACRFHRQGLRAKLNTLQAYESRGKGQISADQIQSLGNAIFRHCKAISKVYPAERQNFKEIWAGAKTILLGLYPGMNTLQSF